MVAAASKIPYYAVRQHENGYAVIVLSRTRTPDCRCQRHSICEVKPRKQIADAYAATLNDLMCTYQLRK